MNYKPNTEDMSTTIFRKNQNYWKLRLKALYLGHLRNAKRTDLLLLSGQKQQHLELQGQSCLICCLLCGHKEQHLRQQFLTVSPCVTAYARFFAVVTKIITASTMTGRHPRSPKQLGPSTDRFWLPLFNRNIKGIADAFIDACMSEWIQMQPVFS